MYPANYCSGSAASHSTGLGIASRNEITAGSIKKHWAMSRGIKI